MLKIFQHNKELIVRNMIVLFFLLICICSCSEEQKHIREANRIMRSYTNYMKNCEHFHLKSFGGRMMTDIKEISLSYKKKENVNINKARRLFVLNSEKLLNLINTDEIIRHYLHIYPFVIKNIELSLFFCDDHGKSVSSEYIALVFYAKGNICYYKFDLAIDNFQQVYEEPYEEALKIVINSKDL